jgi:hypothetical protein
VRPALLDHVAGLGHRVFENGLYNLNIIGIRTAATDPNQFDDRICVVYKDSDDVWITKTWEATTDPGLFWLNHPMKVSGTAILVPGQYRGSHKIAKHQGRYDALCQRKPVKVYRDRNMDDVLDMDPETIEEGCFGINIHRAGVASTQVDKWSAGCQVFARRSDFEDFMSLCRKAADTWGDSFTYTLIPDPED